MSWLTKWGAARFVAALATAAATAASAAPEYAYKQCPTSSAVARWDLLSEKRLPPPIPVENVFPACLPTVSGLYDKWKGEDLTDWERISNEYCSHQAGWVEKVPGTCTAGGPPPICPADHWKRDPDAPEKYARSLGELQEKRRSAMKAAVCACMGAELGAAAREPANADVTGAPGRETSHLERCNSKGDCPPGLDCVARVCTAHPVVPTQPNELETWLSEEALRRVEDEALRRAERNLETLAKKASVIGTLASGALKVLKVTESFPARVLFGVIEPVELSTHRARYTANIERATLLGKAYVPLIKDLEEQKKIASTGAEPLHGACYYRLHLADLDQRVDGVLTKTRAALEGMKTEREFKNNECPEVVEFVTSKLANELAAVKRLASEAAQSGLPERGSRDSEQCR
ncbi:MAG TPA: hypothetical protein VEB43_20555 [Anaeromyxobacter sp.]|nr:hypothetical protein [Anaeromyxobacter sp.]